MNKALLHIQARLTRQAGLELWARLSADRPLWDIELTDEGLSFFIPLVPGTVDAELSIVEENCARLENARVGLEIELSVRRVFDPVPATPPLAAGPWEIVSPAGNPEPPLPTAGPNRLLLPPFFSFSQRFWAGTSLLLESLAEYFAPPPGAPETKGLPVLCLEAPHSLAAVAADLAGSGPISIYAENQESGLWLEELFRLNHRSVPSIQTLPLKTLARKSPQLHQYFGLIVLHLSPYLAASRLKILAGWLAPQGALIISGFAPGPQTALLLRAAAKAGLILSSSISNESWAAMKLVPAPPRENLPPLSGTVVPDLVEMPPEADADLAAPGPEEDEIPDEESLMLPEYPDEEVEE